MAEKSFEKEIGISREGLVVKGTRLVPLVLVGLAILAFLAKGIQWADLGSFSSPLFSTGSHDFKDLDSLIRKLKTPAEQDPLSQFVWGQFSDESRETLSSDLTPRQLQEEVLVKELNKILEHGYSIYSPRLFPSDLSAYDLQLVVIKQKYELPSDGKQLLIVAEKTNAQEQNQLQFRFFDSQGDYTDYDEDDISNRYGERESFKVYLNNFKESFFEDVKSLAPALNQALNSDTALGMIAHGNAMPEKGKNLVILAEAEGKLQVRRFDEAEAKTDYESDSFTSESAAETLDSIKNEENLVREVASRLGYSGLGQKIDREKKLRAGLGGDHTLLNRLLLEHAYVEEIKQNEAKYETGLFKIVKATFGQLFQAVTQAIVTDVPMFVGSQLKTAGILAIFSLIPGIAGLIYRRAFWKWFLGAFVTLFFINWLFVAFGWGEVGAELTKQLQFPYKFYLWIEGLLVILLFAFRLRRHSAETIEPNTKRLRMFQGIVLILLAIGWWYWSHSIHESRLLQFGGAFCLLLAAFSILSQSLSAATDWGSNERKNIVVCFDGTWNQPGQKDFGHLGETNVFKLFKILRGKRTRKHYNASRHKEHVVSEGKKTNSKQISFYYHGVGNKVENSQLGQLFGGAFGMGADAIVERAYLDVVRVYRPGDRIFIFGFSRGAAISRLFAGVIGRRGVPRSVWTLRLFGRHWPLSKSARKIENVAVDVLGCWDTVGSFGISKNLFGIPFQKINLLKDLSVSLCVKRAYHMVALDETRDAFVPTLMDPDPIEPNRVVEVWFSGSHCNVGGGFATDRLSDVALDFLLKHVSSDYANVSDKDLIDKQHLFPYLTSGVSENSGSSWGLYLNDVASISEDVKSIVIDEKEKITLNINPDPRGRLRESSGAMYDFFPRKLPLHAVIFDGVLDRMRDVLPVYAPDSLFKLNDNLVKKREAIVTEVNRLRQTVKFDKENEYDAIMKWSQDKLKITKWSEYLLQTVEVSAKDEPSLRKKILLKDTLNPAGELDNNPRSADGDQN